MAYEEAIKELEAKLKSCQEDSEYLKKREKKHQDIANETRDASDELFKLILGLEETIKFLKKEA